MGKDLQNSLARTAAAGLVAGLAGCGGGDQPDPKVPSDAGPTPEGGADPMAETDDESMDASDEAASDKECCAPGKNPCKGQGACATATNDCAGKNECEGKGGCTPKDCK